MKTKNKIIFPIILLIVLLPIISSFGVSAPYWEDNVLEMAPGSSLTIELNLQNMVGEEDVRVQAELVKGSEIAELKKENYNVKSQTYDTMAEVKIKIPETTPLGQRTQVEVEFKTVPEGQEGMISMGTGMSVGFDVLTTDIQMAPEDEGGFPLTIIIIILAIIIILIIIIWIIKRKKQQLSVPNTSTNFK